MRRWISWVRPESPPRDDSRALRLCVARGNIAYLSDLDPQVEGPEIPMDERKLNPTVAFLKDRSLANDATALILYRFAVAADEATFGLSEVNWAILPGGIVSWNVAQVMSFRDAMYEAESNRLLQLR